LIHCRLVKGGYASSLLEAESLPARKVLQVLNYENFIQEYEEEFIALNAPEK
jgi:hypothetical protein